jgi:hypothetical protein
MGARGDFAMLRRLGVLALVAVCVLAAVGCAPKKAAAPASSTGQAPSVQATGAVPAENTASGQASGPAKVGDELRAGPWVFSVTGVNSKQEAPGQVKPAAGKEFMYVEVSVYNDGTATLPIKPEDFSMKDSSGTLLKPFGKRQAYNAVDMTPLKPKYSTMTAFIYEVPPGSTGYTFTFAPEVDGKKVPLQVSVP